MCVSDAAARKKRIEEQYEEHVGIKQGVGAVKKTLYDVPEYVQERNRPGHVMPANRLPSPIRRAIPRPSTSNNRVTQSARDRIADEEQNRRKLREAERLLGNVQNARTSQRARSVAGQVHDLHLPVTQTEHRELVEIITNESAASANNSRQPQQQQHRPVSASPDANEDEEIQRNPREKALKAINRLHERRKANLENSVVDGLPAENVVRPFALQLLDIWNKAVQTLKKHNSQAIEKARKQYSDNRSDETIKRKLNKYFKIKGDAEKYTNNINIRILDAIKLKQNNKLTKLMNKAIRHMFHDDLMAGGAPEFRHGEIYNNRTRLDKQNAELAREFTNQEKLSGLIPYLEGGQTIPLGWVSSKIIVQIVAAVQFNSYFSDLSGPHSDRNLFE